MHSYRKTNLVYSSVHGEDNKIKYRKSYASTSRGKGVDIFTPNIAGDMPKRTFEDGTKFSEQLRGQSCAYAGVLSY